MKYDESIRKASRETEDANKVQVKALYAIANELAELNERLRERTEDDFNDLVRTWLGG